MRTLAAAILGLWLALGQAAAFDFADWARRPIPGSQRVYYECTAPAACGKASAVSALMLPLNARTNSIEDERRRQRNFVRQLREKSGQQVKVEIDDTREQTIEGLRVLSTEKRVILANGLRQNHLDAVIFGQTRAYSIVVTGVDVDHVRRNFDGYAGVIALVLDQLAVSDRARSAPPAAAFPPLPAPPR